MSPDPHVREIFACIDLLRLLGRLPSDVVNGANGDAHAQDIE